MNRKVFAPDHEMPHQARLQQQDETVDRPGSTVAGQDTDDLKRILQAHPALVAQLASLTPEERVALMLHWMAQLDGESLQTLIAVGQQQLAAAPELPSVAVQHQTRLVLKKDYTYQQQGLSQPTQYYVYLRRRKPKLDRYIGTLFYVPQGCPLSYKVDAAERVLFNPPHNLFQLKDPQDPAAVRLVRLLCLEPPPPDYTFTKQKNDSPQIYLHLEYLDPLTHQILSQECYPFPSCMYEGGPLDRYRWEVSVVSTVPVSPPDAEMPAATSVLNPASALRSASADLTADTSRRLPENSAPSTQFCLVKPEQAPKILERMQLWIRWSDRAMPQARWEIVPPEQPNQTNQTYTLIHSQSRRTILTWQGDRAVVDFHHSLPVVMKWFQELGLAVSEGENQRQYSAAELKLAHSLFINMSLSQTDPLVVLKQLFGVSFKTAFPDAFPDAFTDTDPPADA